MRPTRFSLFVVITLASLCASASAATLAPGSLIHPAPGEAGPTGGTIVAGPLMVPFVSPTYTGMLTTTVYSGDTTNPFAGGLTFVYTLSNGPGTHSINRFSVNGFEGFSVDASYETPVAVGAVLPAYVDRETNGSSVGFSFVAAPVGSGALGPMLTSASLVLQTNATSHVPSIAAVLDGFPATAGTFAPVPEPSTIVLAGAALALVGCRMSRRWRRTES